MTSGVFFAHRKTIRRHLRDRPARRRAAPAGAPADHVAGEVRAEELDGPVIVGGGPGTPVGAEEMWTFMRSRGGTWLLSAIQQV